MTMRAKSLRLLGVCLLSTVLLGGCNWVKLSDAGAQVRVVDSDTAARCIKKGEVTASVRDEVGPYSRNRQKVLDEVETLARNDARELGANAISPIGDLDSGERRYAAYDCL